MARKSDIHTPGSDDTSQPTDTSPHVQLLLDLAHGLAIACGLVGGVGVLAGVLGYAAARLG